MQVKNIECQIAQAQLRRYLTGEEMPQALVTDLEAHLKNCPDCKGAAQQQRESLSGVLSAKIMGNATPEREIQEKGSAIPKRFVRRPEPAQERPVLAKAAVQTPLDILDSPDEEYAAKKPVKKPTNLKTIGYSVGLAVVLVLMSTVFKDPTSLFGPRASNNPQDTPPVESSTASTQQSPVTTNSNVVTPPIDAGSDTSQEGPTSEAGAEATGAPETTDAPAGGNDIIIADAAGTKIEPPKTSSEPANGTIKVYPPAKN